MTPEFLRSGSLTSTVLMAGITVVIAGAYLMAETPHHVAFIVLIAFCVLSTARLYMAYRKQSRNPQLD